MFVEYEIFLFFFIFFLAQFQGAPKSNIKKKLTHGRQFISRSASLKQKNQMVS